ncbi:hypothetical protein VMCG_03185 [Cytospora schulzeri]|uniref:Cytochrome P450 n=1 Tax=Cytospora schulzeri TaxID=448051 RepID=A0A423WY73_9PEZI|nr:hypothetical protein VMCG_03185 [Valsa malicola]
MDQHRLGARLLDLSIQDELRWYNDPTTMTTNIIFVLLGLSVIKLAISLFGRPALPHNAPLLWKPDDWPLLGSLRFFTERTDMVLDATAAHESSGSRTGNFSFFLGKKHVVGIGRTPEARITFYENRNLDLLQGSAELLTALPLAEGDVNRFGTFFTKTLTSTLRGEKLVMNLPLIARDARAMCQLLLNKELATADSEWRVMDTFDVFQRLIFQMTTRTIGAHEIAEDHALGDYTLSIFRGIERRNSVAKIFISWLPTPAHIMRMCDAFRFYRVMSWIVTERMRTGVTQQDTMQLLIDSGTNIKDITAFQLQGLFAGLLNTALNLSWVVLLLSVSPEWKARAIGEVDAVISKHRTSPSQTTADVLDTLSLDSWQTEFPLLVDGCLPEAMRLTMRGTPFRKNVGSLGVPLEKNRDPAEIIPGGSYAAYLIHHVHFDPEIYPDPERFDPGRYEAHRAEHKRAPHVFLGWGTGKHPCLGTRFAKLETAVALAYFLSAVDFEVAADSTGAASSQAPPLPPRNVNLATRPTRPIYLRYKPRSNAL